MRETLFNILAPLVPGSIFLDAYAGTGAVGIEALSRGAERAIFIEKSREAVEIVNQNLESLGLKRRAIVHRGYAAKKLKLESPTIAFVDPPYSETAEYALTLHLLGSMPQDLIAIAQHSSRFPLEEHYGSLERTRIVKQGENTLTFFRSQHPQLDGRADAATEDAGSASLRGGDLEVP